MGRWAALGGTTVARLGTALAALAAVIVLMLFGLAALTSAPTLQIDAAAMTSPAPVVHPVRAPQAEHAAAVEVDLANHASEITVTGTTGPRSTVSVVVNDVPAANDYVGAGGPFTIAHVPVPNDGWNSVAVASTAWHGIRLTSTRLNFGVVNPKPTPAAILFAADAAAGTSDVRLLGRAAPRDPIIVYDSAQPKAGATPHPDAKVVARLRAENDGSFQQTVSLPSGTHELWAATLGCADARCSSGAAHTVSIDHSAPPPAAFATERALTLHFSYQRLTIDVDATIPRSDPVVAKLMQGVGGEQVLSSLYGELSINGHPADSLFVDSIPTFSVAADRVTLRLSSRQPVPPTVLPAISGRVILTERPNYFQQTSWSSDTVTISRGSYRLLTPLPTPDETARDGSVIWDHPFAADGGRIAMTLAFSPWGSAGTLRDFLSLSIFSLLPDAVARFLAFLNGLIFAIPMLAYLVLVRHGPLRGTARWATGICVAPQVFVALAAAQLDVGDELGLPPLGSALVGAAALITVAYVAASLAKRLGDRWWAVLMEESAYGVMIASLVFSAVAVLTSAIDTVAPAARQNGPMWYLGFTTLSITVVVLIGLAKGRLFDDEHAGIDRFGVARAALITIAGALPFAFSRYVAWTKTPALDGTVLGYPGGYAGLIYDYLRQASILSDFLFGLALIWIAFMPGGNGLSPRNFLRIILCCYAVEATTSVLLIPLTFILAWLSFPLILNARAPSGHRRREVREKRDELISRLLYGRTADELTTELQDIEDQHMLGKIDDAAFEAQKTSFQSAIAERIATVCDVFGVAPSEPQTAARTGMWVGWVFVVAHVLLFLSTETAALRVTHTAFPLLVFASYFATGVAQFVGPAFVFGACYELIRGRSGLQKALAVAAWAIACSLPSWWLRLQSPQSVVSIAVETALFYTVLGITFDIVIVRDAAGVRFRMRDVPRLSGIPALSWAGSIIIAAVGVALGGVVTHSFQDVVTSTITTVYRQATLGQ